MQNTLSSSFYITISILVVMMLIIFSSVAGSLLEGEKIQENISLLQEQNIRLALDLELKKQAATYKNTRIYEELKRKEDFGQIHRGEHVYMIIYEELSQKEKRERNGKNSLLQYKIENMTTPARWWFYFTRNNM
jgi:hypothetical protein